MIRHILFCLMFIALPSHAQKYDPLPVAQDMDKATFESQSQLIEKSFESQSKLDFKIRMPNNFIVNPNLQLKNYGKNGVLYGQIFYAYGPSSYDLKSYLSVQSFELDRAISAKNWILSKALSDNYTVKGLISADNGREFDAFYIRLDKFERQEAVRSKGFLHEGKLLLVEYTVPIKLFNRDRDEQIHSIDSFEFVRSYNITPPEEIDSYEYLDSFMVKYPKSWVVIKKHEDLKNQHAVSFKTANENNFLFATANIMVISSRSLRDRVDDNIYPVNFSSIIKENKKMIEDFGFVAQPMLERRDYQLNYETDLKITEVYPLKKKKSHVFIDDKDRAVSHEFWLTVIKTPEENGKNYILSMLLPSRNSNFYQWSIAAEAYRIMVESAR